MKKYTYEQLDKENEQYNKIIKEQQKECWDAKNLSSARIHTWPADA